MNLRQELGLYVDQYQSLCQDLQVQWTEEWPRRYAMVTQITTKPYVTTFNEIDELQSYLENASHGEWRYIRMVVDLATGQNVPFKVKLEFVT